MFIQLFSLKHAVIRGYIYISFYFSKRLSQLSSKWHPWCHSSSSRHEWLHLQGKQWTSSSSSSSPSSSSSVVVVNRAHPHKMDVDSEWKVYVRNIHWLSLDTEERFSLRMVWRGVISRRSVPRLVLAIRGASRGPLRRSRAGPLAVGVRYIPYQGISFRGVPLRCGAWGGRPSSLLPHPP